MAAGLWASPAALETVGIKDEVQPGQAKQWPSLATSYGRAAQPWQVQGIQAI